MHFFENDGLQNFTMQDRGAVGDFPQITPADMDDDGDLDLVAAGYLGGGNLRILIGDNDGTGVFHWTTAHTLSGPSGLLCLESPADMDGDGDLDLVYRSQHQEISILENLGVSGYANHVVSTPGETIEYLLSGDFNADGAVDFVSLSSQRKLLVHYNRGLWDFIDYLDGYGTGLFALGDVYGHGSPLQAMVRQDKGNGPFLGCVIPGWGGGTNDYPVYSVAIHGTLRGSVADFNNDGDMEMVVAGSEDKLLYLPFLIDGNWPYSSTYQWECLELDLDLDRVMPPIDLDSDGDLDLIAWNTGAIRWFENVPMPDVYRLVVDQPKGGESLRIVNYHGTPGDAFFTAVTTDPRNAGGLGQGWFYGLHIPQHQVNWQFGLGTPHRGVLDATGNWARHWNYLPDGAVSGSSFYAVSLHWTPGTGVVTASEAIEFIVP